MVRNVQQRAVNVLRRIRNKIFAVSVILLSVILVSGLFLWSRSPAQCQGYERELFDLYRRQHLTKTYAWYEQHKTHCAVKTGQTPPSASERIVMYHTLSYNAPIYKRNQLEREFAQKGLIAYEQLSSTDKKKALYSQYKQNFEMIIKHIPKEKRS